MPYDLFISYAHQGDNTSREAVAALVARLHAELEADFRRRFNRDLEIFFDKEDIRDFDHWQVRCHRALRDSRFFIACLSRTYLRSDACRWEWEEWCRHELQHGLVGQGAASLWFVKLEDLDAPEDAALLRRWKGDLLQRFHVQCHEWRHDDHGNFLDAAARFELQQLTEHVAQRLRLLTLDRARRGNLPWPNANFVGREPELASLRAALLDAPEPSPAGIHGVGGMGKTALAQAFAYKEAEAFSGGCWLLRCEGRDRLLSVFRTLVDDLEIKLTEEEKLDDTKAVRRVFDVLRARGPALFLLDNVDRPALLAREPMKLLADQPWARLLYTTRLAPDDFTKAGAKIRPLDLDRLPENQAVDLIRRYQPGQAFASAEHEVAAREIVRELSGLTLAVETAAVYLGQCDPRAAEPQYAVDVRDYLNKLCEDLKTGGSEGVMNQLREVTATLRPTLARLDAPTRTVLQIASLLAPDGVALPWARTIAGQSHPELAADAATGESDPWTQLIRGLIGMRLFQPTAEPRVVTIHRIVQRVLESELPEGRDAVQRKLLNLAFERSEALEKQWHQPTCQWEIGPLLAFADSLLIRADIEAPRLVKWLAQWVGDILSPSEQESLLRRALDQQKLNPATEPPEIAITLSNLTNPIWKQARLNEAEALMREALKIDEAHREPTHPFIAIRLNNLAVLLEDTNQLVEAEQLHRRALMIREQHFGPNHPEVAQSLNNLAHLLQTTNQLGEAESLLRRALAIDEQSSGLDHPTVATHLNNLAELLQTTNRLEEAERCFRRALEIWQRSLGDNHPIVATALNNVGQLLEHTGRQADAEQMHRRAIAIQEQKLRPNHPDISISLNHLGVWLQANNRLDEAEPLFQRSLTINELQFGPEHPRVAVALSNLAGCLIDSNRLSEAEPLYRRALAIDTRSFGEDHPEVATTLDNLACVLKDTGRLMEAEPLFQKALAIREQSYGPNHPGVATVLTHLAQLFGDTNRSADSAPLFRRALEMRERSYGPDHPDVATSLVWVAHSLQAANQLAEAEPLMRRALAIFERNFGENHPRVATTLYKLAGLLQMMNRLVEAEPIMRRVLAIREQVLPVDHPDTFSSLEGLADLLERVGKQEECERLRERFADLALRTNAVAPLTRRQLALRFFRRQDYERAEQLLLQLLKEEFEPAGTRHHLARVCLITERFADAREHVTQGWAARANAKFYIVARLLWFQLALEMLNESEKSEVRHQKLVLILGRLKTALQNDGVFMEWTMQPVLDHLKPNLSETDHALLIAIVAALSDRAKLPELDLFPEWRNAAPQPLD